MNAAKHTRMWESFEYVLVFITLYVCAGAITFLLHYFVDKFVPGSGISSYIYQSTLSTPLVRGYIATLLVSFPLFALLFLDTTKRRLQDSSLSDLKARRVLNYLTNHT